MTDTAELERLAASITQGPWILDGIAISHHPEPHGYPIDICLMGEPLGFAGDVSPMMENHEVNARAIALVPDLLAEVIALRADVERLETIRKNLGDMSMLHLKERNADFARATAAEADAERLAVACEYALDCVRINGIEMFPEPFEVALAAHTQRGNAKDGMSDG